MIDQRLKLCITLLNSYEPLPVIKKKESVQAFPPEHIQYLHGFIFANSELPWRLEETIISLIKSRDSVSVKSKAICKVELCNVCRIRRVLLLPMRRSIQTPLQTFPCAAVSDTSC